LTTWTEGRIRGFITSFIRRGFSRWPPRYECLKDARIGKKINPKSGRLAEHFSCASCNGEFLSKEMEVDHIEPVVCTKEGFVDWNTYISRLLVEKHKMQALCKKCHTKKSKQENAERRANK